MEPADEDHRLSEGSFKTVVLEPPSPPLSPPEENGLRAPVFENTQLSSGEVRETNSGRKVVYAHDPHGELFFGNHHTVDLHHGASGDTISQPLNFPGGPSAHIDATLREYHDRLNVNSHMTSTADSSTIKKNNQFKTAVAIFKAFICTGMLYLPNAFGFAGYITSISMLAASAFINWLGMVKLSAVYDEYPVSYQELGRIAFGRWGSRIIDFQVAVSQAFFSMSMFVFVARSTLSCMDDLGVREQDKPRLWFVFLAELVFIMPLALIRDIEGMKSVNIVANVIEIILPHLLPLKLLVP